MGKAIINWVSDENANARALLSELYQQGLTHTDIAAHLSDLWGMTVTKGMVVGVCLRMGLVGRPKVIPKRAPKPPETTEERWLRLAARRLRIEKRRRKYLERGFASEQRRRTKPIHERADQQPNARAAANPRPPLPAGDPLSWGMLTQGTILEGEPWPCHTQPTQTKEKHGA